MKKFISEDDLITVSGEIFIDQKTRNGKVVWVDEKNQRLKFVANPGGAYYCSFKHVHRINGVDVTK